MVIGAVFPREQLEEKTAFAIGQYPPADILFLAQGVDRVIQAFPQKLGVYRQGGAAVSVEAWNTSPGIFRLALLGLMAFSFRSFCTPF